MGGYYVPERKGIDMDRKNAWNTYTKEQLAELDNINEKYKFCLNAGKTERECVELAVSMAEEAGYRNLKDVMAAGGSLKTGDKVYAVCMNKMIALFRIGEEPVSLGMNILGAHIDSPRIDVKQNPQKISVGGSAAFPARSYRKEGRNDCKSLCRRG